TPTPRTARAPPPRSRPWRQSARKGEYRPAERPPSPHSLDVPALARGSPRPQSILRAQRRTSDMPKSITTFLMFEGRAREAMDLYMSLFPNSEIVHMSTYGPQGPGPEGSVMHAIFTINGQQVMVSDSYVKHAFTFTPSTSFF